MHPPRPIAAQPPFKFNWVNISQNESIEFECGHCQRSVASRAGFYPEKKQGVGDLPTIRICPNCNLPTLFRGRDQIPGVIPGESVQHVPAEVLGLYDEARRCVAANAPTASVLASRKLLMNIAVSKGAKAGESFAHYVDHLASKGYAPPDSKDWVDHIRKKGNEATHEIPHMTVEDARELITFNEMLLKFIYEFPNRVPKPPIPPRN